MADTRAQAREKTMARIVDAARHQITTQGGFSLRSVAAEVKMTPPALYRYVENHEALVLRVALAIDADAAGVLTQARDAQPADDPAGRMIAAAVAFRHWALTHRTEFAMVFTNVDVDCLEALQNQAATGLLFSELLAQVWGKYQFELPDLDSLDPGLQEILRDPAVPADLSLFPDELRGLIWLLERAWAALYGTVTLEVFRHIDPRIVEQGHLFRAMLRDQAVPLGLADELPRLLALADELLAGS